MSSAIDITSEQRKTLVELLRQYIPGVAVWAYGSRVQWTARPNSDLDLVAFISLNKKRQIIELKEALAESDLPFLVDLHIWDEIPERFHDIIRKEYVVIQEEEEEPDSVFDFKIDGWDYTSLGEVCARGEGGGVQTGPFGSQLHASDYVENGIPSIMPQNIGDNRIVRDGIAQITLKDAERLERYRVRIGDIVYSRRGDVERRALIRKEENGWLCGTGCLRVRFGSKDVDPAFASFYLGDPRVRSWIVRHAQGATMANLNTAILSALPFVVPPIEEQRAIAQTLSALDDQIELTQNLTDILEAVAQSVFKSWFVDFAPVKAKAGGHEPEGIDAATASLFPNSFNETGSLPKGWSERPLYGIAEFTNGAAYKDSHFCPRGKGLPVIKIAELKAGVTERTNFSAVDLGERYRIEEQEILFSWSGNPDTSIDTFIWSGGPAWLNQHIFKVRENGTASKAWIYFQLKILRPVFAEIARDKQTTGLGHVTIADMKRIMVCKPTDEIARRFDEIAVPMFDKIASNHLTRRTLMALRDSLLPRLVSGKLRVPDAEKLVEAVV